MAIVKLVDPPTLQASGGTPNHPLKNSQNLSNPLKKCRTIKPAYRRKHPEIRHKKTTNMCENVGGKKNSRHRATLP